MPDEPRRGMLGTGTKVGRVDEQTLLGALHRQDGLGDGGIWNRLESAAQATGDGVNPGDGVDVDDPMQGGNEVGQVVVDGSEVDRSFEGLVEQRVKTL